MKIALIFLFLLSAAALGSGEPQNKQLALDANFFIELYKIPPALRDTHLEGKLNAIVMGRGLIQTIDIYQRLKKNYRLVVVDREAGRAGIDITYYIYAADKNTVSLLKKNELFEFTGQLIAYTPLNSKKTSYIFDILLEKGAMLFE